MTAYETWARTKRRILATEIEQVTEPASYCNGEFLINNSACNLRQYFAAQATPPGATSLIGFPRTGMQLALPPPFVIQSAVQGVFILGGDHPMKKLATAAAIATSALALGLFSAGSATASTSDPAVWIGSPVNGNWPNTAGCAGATYPSPPNGNCSLPSVHHTVYYSTFDWGTTIDDWAADDQGVTSGEQVMLYAAPVNSGYTVSAHIDTVGPACGSMRISDGGYRVTVGIYAGSTKIGTVTYAHINPSVSQGQWVSRWGTKIGTVGSYTWGSCWQEPHVHIEMASRHNYSCFSNIFLKYPGAKLSEKNFQGYLGGNYASGPRRACP